jgi:transcriptional regulator with XRE-family HTH domain
MIDTNNDFAAIMRERREQLGLSLRELARRADLDVGTLSKLEAGKTRPSPDSVTAIAHVLGISASDLFAAAGFMPSGELPSLRPYMRAKYVDLPDTALAEVEQFVAELAQKYGTGPFADEDEY